MERVAWTDERLDDLSRRMDAGFERVDREVHALRGEMRSEFTAVRNEIGDLRGLMLKGWAGLAVGLLSILATVLMHGA